MRLLPSCSTAGLVLAAISSVASAQEHSITINGPEEIYLAQKDMTCGGTARGSGRDTTDMPITAFRRRDGSVVVLAGNQNNYYLEGPSIDKARRLSCANLLTPVNDADPAKFVGRRWLVAIHAKSHDYVLGFVHNEYHGNEFFKEGCTKTSQSDFECWYGSTTLAVSYDGGFTFQTPSDHVLATLPFKFETGKKRAGVTSPKVVGNPHDGMTYVMVSYNDRNRQRGYQCLLRGSGKSLDDWRAWDGHGFNLNMKSPYTRERGGDCAQVVRFNVRSLSYVPAIKKFVALGLRGPEVIYAFSEDLIRWTHPKALMNVVRPQTRQPDDAPARAYFSLLDDTSSSINFDTLENRPYMYFVQVDPSDRRKVDAYRVPVVIK